MTSRAAMIAALLSTLGAASVVAQEQDSSPLALPIGVKTRLSTTSVPGLVNGILVRTDHESATFLLEQGGQQKVPLENLTRLDISVSQKRHTLKGLLIGTAIGVGIGFLMEVDPDTCDYYGLTTFCSRSEALLGGVLAGAGVGAGIGALVKTDRWSPVNLDAFRKRGTPLARGPRPHSLSVTVRF